MSGCNCKCNCRFYSPNELVVLSALIAIGIANKFNLEQQSVAGNFLLTVGEIILLINSQLVSIQSYKSKCCDEKNSDSSNGNNESKSNRKGKNNDSELQKQINELKTYISSLEKKVDKINNI